jgi:hypothetical protein
LIIKVIFKLKYQTGRLKHKVKVSDGLPFS